MPEEPITSPIMVRRGLVAIDAGEKDRRTRRATVTRDGRQVLAAALPIWRGEHAALEASLPHDSDGRAFLAALAMESAASPLAPAGAC